MGQWSRPLEPWHSEPLPEQSGSQGQGLMALSMVPGSPQEGEPQPGLRGLFLQEGGTGCGERGGREDLLTGCIGYVLVRGPGRVGREEPGEDRSPCSTHADDHHGGPVGQQE